MPCTHHPQAAKPLKTEGQAVDALPGFSGQPCVAVRQLSTTGDFLDEVHPHDPSGWLAPERQEVTGHKPQVPPTNRRIPGVL
jgi:hypothetical protein